MNLTVDFNDKLPIYQQIVNQVIFHIVSGELHPGDEVPSVRKLAEALVINPNTIVKAYYNLEMTGIVEKRRGMGTYVTEKASDIAKSMSKSIIQGSIDSLLLEANTLQIPINELTVMIEKRAQELKGGSNE